MGDRSMKPAEKNEEEGRRSVKVRCSGGRRALPTTWRARRNVFSISFRSLPRSAKSLRQKQFTRNSGELLNFSQMLNRN